MLSFQTFNYVASGRQLLCCSLSLFTLISVLMGWICGILARLFIYELFNVHRGVAPV